MVCRNLAFSFGLRKRQRLFTFVYKMSPYVIYIVGIGKMIIIIFFCESVCSNQIRNQLYKNFGQLQNIENTISLKTSIRIEII